MSLKHLIMIRYRPSTALLLIAIFAMGLAWWIDHAKMQKKIDAHNSRQLLAELKNCNAKEIAYFDENWPNIRKKLVRLAKPGRLKRLPVADQKALLDELGYLQGCRSPDVFRNHGADILRIMFEFGAEDEMRELRGLFPNVKPITSVD